jgi:hypothetical protein
MNLSANPASAKWRLKLVPQSSRFGFPRETGGLLALKTVSMPIEDGFLKSCR